MPSFRFHEPHLFSFLDALPLGAYVFCLEDPAREESLRILFANRASEEMLGIDPSLVVGGLIGEHFPNSLGKSGVAAAYRAAVVDQAPRDLGLFSYGDELVEQQRFTVSAYPIGPDTVVILFEGLSASPARTTELAAIVDSAEDAIFSRALDGTVVSWNPGAERLLGYTADEMIGNPIDVLLVGEAAELLDLRERLNRGERIEALETRMRRKDGSEVFVSAAASPITNERGCVVGIAAVARDATDRRRLEEQLRQSQKLEAIGSLAGGVAHDFNNILTVIRTTTGAIRRGQLDEPLNRRIRQIELAAEHAATLTRQLLAFSRQQVLQPEPTDLNAVMETTLELVRRLIGEQIQLEYRPGADLGAALVDRGQLQQVILNLSVNARDAMPDGGVLTVRTANAVLDDGYVSDHFEVAPGAYVVLEIADSGVGMDADTRARIFDPFFTTKGEGTGLGLATVYGIVKQSGGHVWVYSEPGQGTTFKLYFPAADAPVPATHVPAAAPDSLNGDETILLVEDAELLRPIVAELLESYGYTILPAADGIEALAVAMQHPGALDLLLTDVVMPRMNGRELAEQLRKTHPEMKILFTSGYPADTIIRHGIAEARFAFIQKPYVGNELLTKIRSTLATGR